LSQLPTITGEIGENVTQKESASSAAPLDLVPGASLYYDAE